MTRRHQRLYVPRRHGTRQQSQCTASNFGYHLDKVVYEIIFAPEAIEDLKRSPKIEARAVVGAIELHLRHAPELVSRSRIKRLRELTSPQYRLRVGEWRVFYDVVASEILIRGVVRKSEVNDWLAEFGESS